MTDKPNVRRTIAGPVSVEGIGLHLGHDCCLTFRGAEAGTGIRFRRVDLEGAPVIPALVGAAVESERRTQLGTGDAALHTVEHVLAAVTGLEIDDLEIEMNAPEPPVADGSAAPFVEALDRAGIAEQPGTVQYLDVRRPLRVEDGDSVYEALPCDALQLEVSIEFPHPVIGRQRGAYRLVGDAFRAELAAARTFGFVREVEMLRAKGLIRGATTANAVVLDDVGVVDTTLRWPDEFVRHKAMDCVGDLALAGRRVRGRIRAHRPSHRGTIMLVRELVNMADEQARTLEIDEIMKVLPHRYPFLLVDRIVDFEPRKRIVGIKNVTINEPFFQGHFPGHPIMPGVLMIEAMAQVGGMLLMGAIDDPENKVVYFMSLDKIKFRRPVKPGDQLRFELEMQQIRGSVCKMRGVGYVDGNVVVEAEMAAMIRDK